MTNKLSMIYRFITIRDRLRTFHSTVPAEEIGIILPRASAFLRIAEET